MGSSLRAAPRVRALLRSPGMTGEGTPGLQEPPDSLRRPRTGPTTFGLRKRRPEPPLASPQGEGRLATKHVHPREPWGSEGMRGRGTPETSRVG